MKQLFILILLFGTATIGYSQTAHTTNCPFCVYTKLKVDPKKLGAFSESCGCRPCGEKKQKEKAARLAELKRRDDMLAAESKAKRAAEQKALAAERQRKREEQDKTIRASEVLINAHPTAAITTKAPPQKKVQTVGDKTIFKKSRGYQDFRGSHIVAAFFNEKDELIIENGDWSSAALISEISFTVDTVPKSYGVVRIGDKNFYWRDQTYNLVNAKGEYLMDDNAIWSIQHIRKGWFLISSRLSGNYLLNLQTKKKITLPFYGKTSQMAAYKSYAPVFSDKIAMSTRRIQNFIAGEHMVSECKRVKEEMMKYFADKVNEEVLSRYSFVLFHTDEGDATSTLGNYNHYVYYNQTDKVGRIEMFGMKENGEMETVRIK